MSTYCSYCAKEEISICRRREVEKERVNVFMLAGKADRKVVITSIYDFNVVYLICPSSVSIYFETTRDGSY